MGIWVVSTFLDIEIILLWMWVYAYHYEILLLIILYIYSEVILLKYMAILYFIILKNHHTFYEGGKKVIHL